MNRTIYRGRRVWAHGGLIMWSAHRTERFRRRSAAAAAVAAAIAAAAICAAAAVAAAVAAAAGNVSSMTSLDPGEQWCRLRILAVARVIFWC